MTSEQYYNDPSKFGNYQYVTLKDIINNYMMSKDPDDYSAHTPRFKVLYQAMRGMRELYFDVLQEIRAIQLELSPNLTVILPPDFINYTRISWINEEGLLIPMAEDRRMPISQDYLQDNNYNLLFDSDGCVLIGNRQKPMDDYVVEDSVEEGADLGMVYSFNFEPNRDLSKDFSKGRYRINKSEGVIQFGSSVEGKEIVLEYVSDGLYTGCEGVPEEELKIHKFAEAALINFISYELIKNRRNVPANEKQRARKEFYNSRRITKMRMNALRKSELSQIFKGASQWIKEPS